MITIVDCGLGNIGSIVNMLRKVGIAAQRVSTIDGIAKAEKLILPGVGSFDHGMRSLRENGLIEVLSERVIRREVPMLGICLGMQLLTESSEEGNEPGLGWLKAKTVKFHFEERHADLKIPHMRWNEVHPVRRDTLFHDLDDDAGFYFVHSYHVVCENQKDVLATANHGYDFACAVQRGNIFGTQFHPEKSHRYGMTLLKQFVQLSSNRC